MKGCELDASESPPSPALVPKNDQRVTVFGQFLCHIVSPLITFTSLFQKTPTSANMKSQSNQNVAAEVDSDLKQETVQPEITKELL